MEKPVLVNLHCHSIFSDGTLTPEQLAARLAAAHVRFASLTDHDSLEGLPAFGQALHTHGIGCIPGVELTTRYQQREMHLLGYGFDPEHPALLATLRSLRQVQNQDIHSIAGSLRRAGSRNGPSGAPSAAPGGRLAIHDAVDLLHSAGGKAFLAHPFLFEPDPSRLDTLLAELKAIGLDGIEAWYTPFTHEQQQTLLGLAGKHGLLVSAGSDFHHDSGPETIHPVEMPRADWVPFRRAVLSGLASTGNAAPPGSENSSPVQEPGSGRWKTFLRLRPFILRIVLPTFLAVALFLSALWGYLLPSFEHTLLERKREMIRELTNTAWSILNSYEQEHTRGELTLAEAQLLAAARIEALRYGPEGKDYFWIQDSGPVMVMHPYLPDLNGENLAAFTDPAGNRVFVEFAAVVNRDGEGTVDYVWQWKDDPTRLEPKESFVMGFEPWGWIIGTGIYIDDVHQEIARLERSLIHVSLGISGGMILLLAFVLSQSLRLERKRQEVVDALRESTGRFHALVEAATEGTLLILDGRCRYANPTFLEMTGFHASELEFLELEDILPGIPENAGLRHILENPDHGQSLPGPREGCLQTADGTLDCILTLTPIQIAGREGLILLARDASATSADSHLPPELVSLPAGFFLARASRKGVFLEINPAGRSLLPPLPDNGGQHSLADLFQSDQQFEQFMKTLLEQGSVVNIPLTIPLPDAGIRFLSLSASIVEDAGREQKVIAGLLTDTTRAQKRTMEQDALIRELQSSLLFLHQPVSSLNRNLVGCQLETSILEASRILTANSAAAAVVHSESGKAVGIVTDHDLRERVLAADLDPASPVHLVMSAPLIRVPERARIYEALIVMEEKGVRHLAVENQAGEIVNILDSKALVQFQRYGPIVLEREIARAESPAEVALASGHRTQLMRSLLESSARPRYVTRMLASIWDAAARHLIELAAAELGEPPAPFTFVAMGSQGRMEQTLLTDQDNGIIYADSGHESTRAAEYFLALGKRVSDGLNKAGLPYCPGGVMASQPRWCRSLSEWIADVNLLVQKSEPRELMEFSIFFDFRRVYGDRDLAAQLRDQVHHVLQEKPSFFPLFARQSLKFKPPIRLPGNIYLSSSLEPGAAIDLKEALMPVVGFARLYALHNQLNLTHTLERLEALAERGILQQSTLENISSAYNFLIQLRLEAQLKAEALGKPLPNSVHPAHLSTAQQDQLKQAFTQISAVQKKISYDFLGGN